MIRKNPLDWQMKGRILAACSIAISDDWINLPKKFQNHENHKIYHRKIGL